MNPDYLHDDPLLEALHELPTCDVSPARAERLRARCHRDLQRQHASSHVPPGADAAVWPRSLRVLAVTWCVLYLLEIIREAVTVYAF